MAKISVFNVGSIDSTVYFYKSEKKNIQKANKSNISLFYNENVQNHREDMRKDMHNLSKIHKNANCLIFYVCFIYILRFSFFVY